MIDGELVCLDAEGRSIFKELPLRRGCPIFYAFDLLYLNGRDVRQLPLMEQKEKLRAVIEKSARPDRPFLVELQPSAYSRYLEP